MYVSIKIPISVLVFFLFIGFVGMKNKSRHLSPEVVRVSQVLKVKEKLEWCCDCRSGQNSRGSAIFSVRISAVTWAFEHCFVTAEFCRRYSSLMLPGPHVIGKGILEEDSRGSRTSENPYSYHHYTFRATRLSAFTPCRGRITWWIKMWIPETSYRALNPGSAMWAWEN